MPSDRPSTHPGSGSLAPADLNRALEVALHLGTRAGALLLAIYNEGFEVHTKADGSPVTRADREAEALIVAGLLAAFPDDAVVGEETGRTGAADARRVWLVDPLDGTADFAGLTDDFCAMIGLCIDGEPVLGVLAAPALGRMWAGVVGQGAIEVVGDERRPLRLPEAEIINKIEPLHLVQSRSHPPAGLAERLAASLGHAPTLSQRGSVGVKVGLVISGEAHGYLHPQAGTSLWDCAGPEAVMRAAGGRFSRPDGSPVDYAAACDAEAVRQGRHLHNAPGILAGPTDVWTRLRA
jgi:3'(2'), 5'-bisphosphate nucleotidase